MKLVFLIGQRNEYRILSTIVIEALNRKHKVEIVHQLNGTKSDLVEYSPFFKKKSSNISFINISSEKDLITFIEKSELVDFFLSIHPIAFQLTGLAQLKVTDRWCIIQHGFDSFAEVWHWNKFDFSAKINQNYNRLFFAHSSFFYEKGLHFLKKFESNNYKANYLFFESSRTTIIPVGSTMYSGEPKLINKKDIRIKYNIPSDKNIVIYLPFPFYPLRAKYSKKGSYAWQAAFSGLFLNYENNGRTVFMKFKNLLMFLLKKIIYLTKVLMNFEAIIWLLRKWNEPRVIREVKKFCDTNNLILIAKTRKKFPYVKQINESCFSIFEDDSQHCPSLLQELFSIADLVIGFQSTTVLESVLHNTRYLNIQSSDSILNNDAARLYWHSSNEGDMYKSRGVVNSMKIPELIANFHKMTLNDLNIDSKQKREYMKKYLGDEGSNPSANLVNYLEENKKVFL
jgi:hypothetical protein